MLLVLGADVDSVLLIELTDTKHWLVVMLEELSDCCLLLAVEGVLLLNIDVARFKFKLTCSSLGC